MPSAAEPLRIIQVGAGAMGQAWLKLLGESDQTELVGLVDLNIDAARQAAEQHGVPVLAGRNRQRLSDLLAGAQPYIRTRPA